MKHVFKIHLSRPVVTVLIAALLFGLSTPFAKIFLISVSPVLLASLLYLGSGLGLFLMRIIRDHGWRQVSLNLCEWGIFSSAIACGGILAPILLLNGLTGVSSADASLLLNLEAVFTAVIAWVIFKENADRRIVLGMLLIVAGGVVLSCQQKILSFHASLGMLSIAAACLCWAIDNNLTRKIASGDALFLAGTKGLIAGVVNLLIAWWWLSAKLPNYPTVLIVMLGGFFSYGLSLVLFILALRKLGTSRTGAYFSVAPFIGALVGIIFLGENSSWAFWGALSLMVSGVWLHLTENHEHLHTHDALWHQHSYPHDGAHGGTINPNIPHQHPQLSHSHAHYPDSEHIHRHD